MTVAPDDVMTAVREIGEQKELWPGFRPSAIPVAIYDGAQTWLFSHPRPPDGFKPLSGSISIYEGLHHAVRANTAHPVGDVLTAVIMSFDRHGSPEEWASIVIHEMFHVFQLTHHEHWWTDEGERFLYPVFDEEALCLRRLETRMLRLALSTADDAGSRRFAATAVELRKRRYALIGAKPAAYERGMERIEGLAHYVEDLSIGRIDPRIPDEEYSPDDVRGRCYAVGAAWARLLDRHCHGWKEDFDRSPNAPALDVALDGAIGASSLPVGEAPDVVDGERTKAVEDIRALRRRYEDMKEQFATLPGWRVVFRSADKGLMRAASMDPSNMTALNLTEVLHARYLAVNVGAGSGEIEVLGACALTESGGAHPLFDGIQCLTVAGLADKPAVVHEAESVELRASGLTARLAEATVQVHDQIMHVIVGA